MPRIYEIYYPEIDTPVSFKVLSLDETQSLVNRYTELDDDSYMRIVVEACVTNLKTTVAGALKVLPKEKAAKFLIGLYNSSVMLNPGLDIESWLSISNAPMLVSAATQNKYSPLTKRMNKMAVKPKPKKISRQKFINLERHLKEQIIGQDEAIEELVRALRRSQAGLSDENRPVGVFMFSGSSGVGKTSLAKVLASYLYDNVEMIRIDCGEYQHKHETSKLTGSPSGYVGYEEGSLLTDALEKNPATVILFDEIEKAHPDLFNLFLPAIDEGFITDAKGNKLNFRDSIIIMTTNLGNGDITAEMQSASVGFSKKTDGPLPREAVEKATLKAIRKHFRPEFINRFDKTIVFNYLTQEDYFKIAELELNAIQRKLDKRGCTLEFDESAIAAMVKDGVNHTQGARGLAQIRRDRIEDILATLMLNGRYPRGTVFQLTHESDNYRISAHRPVFKKRMPVVNAT